MDNLRNWAFHQEKDNAIIKVFDNDRLIGTYWCTEEKRDIVKMKELLKASLEIYKKTDNLDEFKISLLSDIDNVEFNFTEYEYRLYLSEGRLEIWATKREVVNGLNRWVAGIKIFSEII